MTIQVNWNCDQHDGPFSCRDILVGILARFQEYELIIHDGALQASGSSSARGAHGLSLNRNETNDAKNWKVAGSIHGRTRFRPCFRAIAG
ncbi:DUF6980 family protein [Streptomyces sp. 900116325]